MSLELDEWIDQEIEKCDDRRERLERFAVTVYRMTHNGRDPRDPAREDRRMDAAAWEEWFGRPESEWGER